MHDEQKKSGYSVATFINLKNKVMKFKDVVGIDVSKLKNDAILYSSKDSFRFENNFSLGGFTYEIILKNKDVKILIDLNGKLLHGDYEDYIFDIDRRNIALQTNAKYYRLWLSNFYNNPDFEINKISRLLEF